MIRLNLQNTTSSRVGAADGLTEKEFKDFIRKQADTLKDVRAVKDKGGFGFAKLPFDEEEALRILKAAAERRQAFQNFVHVGIGGSSLGAVALCRALAHPYHNDLPADARGGPKTYFVDHVDPEGISKLFDGVDPKKTLFYVVTKSGETVETITALTVLFERVKKACGVRFRNHVVVSTDPEKGFLRQFSRDQRLLGLTIPCDVGGRFSALTSVGLFPAAMTGIDVRAILDGARKMDRFCTSLNPDENLAFLYAAATFLLNERKGKRIQVFMPYAVALEAVADWFVQLWAESLGKKHALNGKVVQAGQTPVKALGARDQHSVIQLFNEGPNDKVISFLDVDQFRWDDKIPDSVDGGDTTSFLKGKRISEVLHAEKQGTETALTANKRPNLTLSLKEISPATLGGLLFTLEWAVVYFARFANVNPFDQPGVEAGKRAAFQLLGKPGYRKETQKLSITPPARR